MLKELWADGVLLRDIADRMNATIEAGEVARDHRTICKYRKILGLPSRYGKEHEPIAEFRPAVNAPPDEVVAAAFAGSMFEDDPTACRPERLFRPLPPPSLNGGSSAGFLSVLLAVSMLFGSHPAQAEPFMAAPNDRLILSGSEVVQPKEMVIPVGSTVCKTQDLMGCYVTSVLRRIDHINFIPDAAQLMIWGTDGTELTPVYVSRADGERFWR